MHVFYIVLGSVMKTICFAAFVFATLYLKDSRADEDSEQGIVHSQPAYSVGPPSAYQRSAIAWRVDSGLLLYA